ncbi:hypothetical protein DMENIID0001_155530 [Sergentomyia squamirostris]
MRKSQFSFWGQERNEDTHMWRNLPGERQWHPTQSIRKSFRVCGHDAGNGGRADASWRRRQVVVADGGSLPSVKTEIDGINEPIKLKSNSKGEIVWKGIKLQESLNDDWKGGKCFFRTNNYSPTCHSPPPEKMGLKTWLKMEFGGKEQKWK